MAKVQIKSDKITPFGGIIPIMDKFDSMLSSTIDSTLGLRCRQFGFQYSEILRSLMCVHLCGGSCVEDVSSHLMPHLSLHPTLRTCSADTILRAIKELTGQNVTYTSQSDKSYDFNTAAQVIHGREHCLPAADGIDTLFLQGHHAATASEPVRTQAHKPHQGIRVQVHLGFWQEGQDIKTAGAENLHREHRIHQHTQPRYGMSPVFVGFCTRIASSRIVG